MKVQTFSIIVGSTACNASCPFCISRQTGEIPSSGQLNVINFKRACRLAQLGGSTTVLLTGKGEPTLYINEIDNYLKELKEFNFPRIELQTNGIRICDDYLATKCVYGNGVIATEYPVLADDYLKRWYENGMTTIALSIVSYDPVVNKMIYTPNRATEISLANLTRKIHDNGLMVRWSVTMLKDKIDSIDSVKSLIAIAKDCAVEQLTLRRVAVYDKSANSKIKEWTEEHQPRNYAQIYKWLDKNATKLMTLQHGGIVYDYEGQNVCVGDCLTIESGSDDIRTLIYCPDGLTRYDWRYNGAIL